MNKVPYTNNTDRIQHIGPITVWPGNTREVDPRDLPGALPAETKAPTPPESPAAILRAKSAKEIDEAVKARGEGGAPLVADEVLAELITLEQGSEKPRKGLLGVLEAETLERAKARTGGNL